MNTNMPQPRLGKLLWPPLRFSRAARRVPLPLGIAAACRAGPTALWDAVPQREVLPGIALLHCFVPKLARRKMTGRVVIVPGADVPALRVGSRGVPEDARDLNRRFSRDAADRLSERIAPLILTALGSRAEWEVALQDSEVGSVRLPHARGQEQDVLDFGAGCGTGQS